MSKNNLSCASSGCCCSPKPERSFRQEVLKCSLAFFLVFLGIILEALNFSLFASRWVSFFWFLIPYLIVMKDVLLHFFTLIKQKDFFNEVTLMTTASILAFVIGEYAEGAGVMVFYAIGELIEGHAAGKARKNIQSLLELKPDTAYVVEGNDIRSVSPEQVAVGSILEILPGGRVPLDGVLLEASSSFNTAALTGESVPRTIREGQPVLAGMIAHLQTVRIKTTRLFQDSTLARILDMVQNAAQHKAPTEAFMRKFSHVYTPIVALIAFLMIFLPFGHALITNTPFELRRWLYAAAITLIISCPCAFVISVPLGYFGGIGLAARNGILFKGGNILEAIAHLKYLATDKTGTMTKGVFTIQKIFSSNISEDVLISLMATAEQKSTHPIARAICDYAKEKNYPLKPIRQNEELAGLGIKVEIDGQQVLVGSHKLMQHFGIEIPQEALQSAATHVFCTMDKVLMGFVLLADEVKEDAAEAVRLLHRYGIRVLMLSGDKDAIVQETAKELGIDQAIGNLLPEEKAQFIQEFKKNHKGTLAFAGDGINDAPVLALSDIGIAMGSIGSDLAVETADVVIQTDEPSKIISAVRAARITRTIVFQNIILAFAVKFIVMALAVGHMASLWEGIFADVGVSIIAIFNAVRIQGKDIRAK